MCNKTELFVTLLPETELNCGSSKKITVKIQKTTFSFLSLQREIQSNPFMDWPQLQGKLCVDALQQCDTVSGAAEID